MNLSKPILLSETTDEVSALIETLHQAGRRLEELTAGEVDAVADRDGRTFLLPSAQEQLRHIEAEKQAALLNALPAHIAMLDHQGIIVSVNSAWGRFAGEDVLQGSEHGVGVNYLHFCANARGEHSSEARQVGEGIRSVLDGGAKGFSIEYPCHSPAEQRWFLLTVTPLAGDGPNGAVVMHLDVTAQRQAEQSLRISESRFRQMADNISEVFFLQDLDRSHIYYVSPAYQQIWGRTCESLYADPSSWADSIHPDDRDNAFENFSERSEPGFDREYRIIRPDGEIRWIHSRGFPILDDAGNPYRTAGIASDVTSRKQSAEELRRSESLKGAILESSLDGLVVVDHEGRIVEFNPAAEATFGWTREQVLGKTMVESIVPPRLREAHRRGFAHYLATGIGPILGKRLELSAIRADGTEFPIELTIAALAATSRPMFTAFIRDITERKRASDELLESERRFSDLLRHVELVSVMLDCEGRITYCNEYMLRLTDWRLDQVIGRDWFEVFMPSDLTGIKSVFLDLLVNSADAWHVENDILTRSGERRLIRWNNSVLRSASGEVIGTASIGEDITERRRAEARVVYLNRVYAMLSGINTLIVRARDRDELFSGACRIAVENGGFRMSLIARVNLGALKIVPVASAGNDDALLTSLKDLLSSTEAGAKTIVARAILDRKAVVSNDLQDDPFVVLGEEYAQRSARSMAILPLIVAGEAAGIIALYANESQFFQQDELNLLMELADDIALAIDRIGSRERLEYLAYYDVLTGLANRSLFIDRVAQHMRAAVSGGHQLALFLIDLERFKNINDSLGRPAGDALLKQAAEWLARNAGDASLVARVDADHFAAVLPRLAREGDVPRLLDKMIHAFQEHPFLLEDTVLRLAVKVGVAIFPEDGATADTLFKNAEAALKKAKASGDRFLFFTQKMTAMVAGKLTLETQLRHALEKEEFVIYYQPKVNLASGRLTSAEALIRWNDPRTGMVAPSGFIPMLEETGLIHDVGRWVLRKAVEDYLRWLSAGLAAVRIAVNVSPLQLRHRDFIAEIKGVIGIDSRAPAGLELEITESLIMEDVTHNIASLQAIRAMGVRIAVDDFGTGFSSLSYLSKLPLDTLKIDRSFIVDMTSGPEGLALVSTVINLAHSLKLNVVAEGVETEEQSRLLRLLSCDEMQGNLFSKPMPRELFETEYLSAMPHAQSTTH